MMIIHTPNAVKGMKICGITINPSSFSRTSHNWYIMGSNPVILILVVMCFSNYYILIRPIIHHTKNKR